jgi:hypothetical protein
LPGSGAVAALPASELTGSNEVLTAAGQVGVVAGLALGVSLAILFMAYAVVIRHPPSEHALLAAAAGSVAAALAMPLLFSADIYAYAYYGDLALHGRTPYGHGAAPSGDPLAAAAVAAWDGRVPPRCVYGPVAVAIAALADAAGFAGGVGAQIFLQRLAATAAYALYVAMVLRLVRDERSRAAFVLNPVVIWSVADGRVGARRARAAARPPTPLRPGDAGQGARDLDLSPQRRPVDSFPQRSRPDGDVVGFDPRYRGISATRRLDSERCAFAYGRGCWKCRRLAIAAGAGDRARRPHSGDCSGPRPPRCRWARRAAVARTTTHAGVRIGGMVCPAERVSVVCVVDCAAGRTRYLVVVVASTPGRGDVLSRPGDYRCRLSGT